MVAKNAARTGDPQQFRKVLEMCLVMHVVGAGEGGQPENTFISDIVWSCFQL